MSTPAPSPHLWKNYTKPEIAKLCFAYGDLLKDHLENSDDGSGLDDPELRRIQGPQLLFAIAGVESSFGANCKPRYEPAYMPGGLYYQQSTPSSAFRTLYAKYGRDAAASYGPWQLLLCNAPGFTPYELANDAEKACQATIGFFKRYVFGIRFARTLEQIADTYNSGTWRDAVTPTVQGYIRKVTHSYFNEVIAL